MARPSIIGRRPFFRALRIPSKWINRLVSLLLGVVVVSAAISLSRAEDPAALRMRNWVFDAYMQAAPRPYNPETPVHIIDIDEASLAEFGQWPWPRPYMALLSDRLNDLGAAAIGYDILFAEPDRTAPEAVAASAERLGLLRDGRATDKSDAAMPQNLAATSHDVTFAAALARAPSVLSISGADKTQEQQSPPSPKAGISLMGGMSEGVLISFDAAVNNIDALDAAATGLGAINLGWSGDGIVRRVPMVSDLSGVMMPSLSVEMLRVAQGVGGIIVKTSDASGEMSGGAAAKPVALKVGAFELPLEADGTFRVYYAGPQPLRVSSARDILMGDPTLLRGSVEGKIVFIGSSALGLFDLRATPMSEQIAGVTIHAEIIEQILDQRFLERPDWSAGLEVALIFLVGVILTLTLVLQRPIASIFAAAVLIIGTLAASFSLFAWRGFLLDPVFPTFAAVLIFLPGATLGILTKERARRAVRDRFAHFLPPALVGEIADDPDRLLTPQGADRALSVMFVDMRRFTTVTENMSSTATVQLVNTYLSAVSEALVAQGATIDKFMGDAVMAFWNAPLEDPHHGRKALLAIAAVEAAVQQANTDLQRAGLPAIEIAIGLNKGHCSVGLMGSSDRLSYTCIGDAVTLAARLEGLTRMYGVMNCVGEDLLSDLPENLIALELDLVRVKGRAAASAVYTIVPRSDEMLEAQIALKAARELFANREWDAANAAFEALGLKQISGLSLAHLVALYRSRIDTYKENPPPLDWDGSFSAQSKR